ncbi:hypothetical protein BH10PSE7_BH10PSE7_21210 [soil metagenome]
MAANSSSSENYRVKVAVSLTLASGAVLNGHILTGMSGKLRETLNGPNEFIEFEGRAGNVIFLGKSLLQSVAAIDTPRTDQLTRHQSSDEAMDPRRVLGIPETAGHDEIRAAYWSKARLYHPDNLAGKNMPPEVADYMKSMFIIVTRAYEEISAQKAEV